MKIFCGEFGAPGIILWAFTAPEIFRGNSRRLQEFFEQIFGSGIFSFFSELF